MLSGALVLALGWMAYRGAPAAAEAAGGTVRFNAEFAPGVVPTFTPIVRMSADGRQLFVTAMVDRREEVLRRPLDRLQHGGDPRRGAGRPGHRQQPALRVARRPVARLRQAGKAAEGPGGGRPRHRSGGVRLGRRELGTRRATGVHPVLQHRALDGERERRRRARCSPSRTPRRASWATGGRRSCPMATTSSSPRTARRSSAPPSRCSPSPPASARCCSPAASSASTCRRDTSCTRWARRFARCRSTSSASPSPVPRARWWTVSR